MKNKKIMMLLVSFTPVFFLVNAHATIYKCVNINANVYYNDKPCPKNDIERQLKSVKDPVGGYIPPEFVEQKNINSFEENKDSKSLQNIENKASSELKTESVNINNSSNSENVIEKNTERLVNLDNKSNSKNKTVFDQNTTKLIFE